VSKPKQKNIPVKPVVIPEVKKQPVTSTPKEFILKYPMLWLTIAVAVVYCVSFGFGFTELDDSIFIKEMQGYNQDLSNLVTSFGRGVFDATKDPYYRPLFLDSMVLNYHFSGEDIMWYHVVNVLFHLCSVLLLYKLFTKLNVKAVPAFILTLIFAVHPVLSQAVAWIPGRNDTLLAIFTISFLICSVNYTVKGNPLSLLLSACCLLLAFFTKETAVFDAPVAFVLLVFVVNAKWLSKRNIIQYGIWVACFLIWFLARSRATIQASGMEAGSVLGSFVHKLPLVIQYIGKIFIPINLSVFPMQQDTVYYYGVIAIVLLTLLILLAKDKNWKVIGAGFAVFILFLLPALLVPDKLNDQTFEHRLYLPMIGMLLLLSQTVLFKNNLKDVQLTAAGVGLAAILGVVNYSHQQSFTDPKTFWDAAAETSPHSAYANMMMAARMQKGPESYALLRKAYSLDSNQKYLNYYYGVMLQDQDSILASEPYFLKEKKISDYVECDLDLARVAITKQDFPGAIAYLQSYLKRVPQSQIANNNLLLLYFNTKQIDNARAQVRKMQQQGMQVPKQTLQQLGM